MIPPPFRPLHSSASQPATAAGMGSRPPLASYHGRVCQSPTLVLLQLWHLSTDSRCAFCSSDPTDTTDTSARHARWRDFITSVLCCGCWLLFMLLCAVLQCAHCWWRVLLLCCLLMGPVALLQFF